MSWRALKEPKRWERAVSVAGRRMEFGLVVVGDEILLGKREDSHVAFVREALAKRGLSLSWVRIVGDDPDLLVQTFREVFASGAAVFSCGGIGATPDDLTRQAAAEAAGVPLELHPEGLALLEAKFGDLFNERRQRLIEFPQGASLIPNPVNQVPGFSLSNDVSDRNKASKRPSAAFVPGFPTMAQPMIEWVLDEYYADYFKDEPDIERRLRVFRVPESDLIPLIDAVAARCPEIKISCLPDARRNGIVELGMRGAADQAIEASQEMRLRLDAQQMRYSALD